jgi:hypothetical protein
VSTLVRLDACATDTKAARYAAYSEWDRIKSAIDAVNECDVCPAESSAPLG